MTRMLKTLAFVLVLLPFASRAEAQLAPAAAGNFMGSWSLALDTPQGNFEQTLVLKDEAGKVVGEMTSAMAPETQKVTDVTKKGDDLDAMLRKLGRGLFVTELMGQGVNYVTGDYSRGAAGFWVEDGRMVHPVHEVTIAGNMKQMFRDIAAIGADAYTQGSKTVGSVLLPRMKLAGA